MPKAYQIYDPVGSGVATSTGTADVKTLAVPTSRGARTANACFLSVKGTKARITFDGSNPDPATGNGLVFDVGGPLYWPFARDIKICADVAGTSEVAVIWME